MMSLLKKHLIILCLISTFFVACGNSETTTKNKSSVKNTTDVNEAATVNHDCAHCGMPSKEFPKWHAKITHKAGESWTCSPRCMLIHTKDTETVPEGITKIEVIDYYNNEWVDAKAAFFVQGGDIAGPMGKDFIPCKTEGDAQEFKKDHQGQAILKYEEISLEGIKKMLLK